MINRPCTGLYRRLVSQILVIVLALQIVSRVDTRHDRRSKPKLLSMLVLVPFTGDEPRDGEACQAASDLVIDVVNSRRDILPDFHIQPVYRDAGPGAIFAPQEAINFKRSFEDSAIINKENNEPLLQAPVIIGPYFSVGCKALGAFAHEIDMVEISVGCGSPLFTGNRKLFPNFYRIRQTAELVAYPQLHFMTEVGNWSRFGILTNADNFFDYSIASFLQKEATANGYEVSFFDCVPDFDDRTMEALKASDSRVVVLDVSIPSLMIRFLCQSYKFGLTGPNYAFILHYAPYLEPTSLPDQWRNCSREIIFEQLKYSFWSGWISVTDSQNLQSSLGLNLTEFDRRLVNYTKNLKPVDYDKRVWCHDATLQAVLAMDEADKTLRRYYNMTLGDYENNSNLITRVVNATMARLEYNGLRIEENRYSHRAELDDDTQLIAQWTPPDNFRTLYKVELIPNSSLYNYSSYEIKLLQSPTWFSASETPPRDRWKIVVKTDTVPNHIFLFVTITGCLLGTFQLLSVIYAVNVPRESEAFPFGKVFFGIGCCLADIGAILFSLKATMQSPSYLCSLRAFFITTGFAFMQGSLLSPMLVLKYLKDHDKIYHESRAQSSSIVVKSGSSLKTCSPNSVGDANAINAHRPISEMVFIEEYVKAAANRSNECETSHRNNSVLFESGTLIGTGVLVGANTLLLAVSLGLDPGKFVVIPLTPEPLYNRETDTFSSVNVVMCVSWFDSARIVLLGCVHGTLLAVGVYLTYDLRDYAKAVRMNNFHLYSMSILNAATLFYGAIFILFLIRSLTSKLGAVSLITLIISGLTSFLLFGLSALCQI